MRTFLGMILGALLLVAGTHKNDRISVVLDGANLIARVNGVSESIPTSSFTSIVIDSRRGDDAIQVLNTGGVIAVAMKIWAHAGRDLILGGDGPEHIFAGDDDDTVNGGGGRDTIYGGLSDQDRTREHRALTLEWRGESKLLSGDVAARRDIFNRFKDVTSLRASLLTNVGGGFAVAGSYAEGIAQPTFFDLYGFFPNNFLGNPSLKPESSRGFEVSLRYRRGPLEASLTGYRQRLHDEIVDIFDPVTFLFSTANRSETSRRSGVEAELGWQLADKLRLTASYAYLKATQPGETGLTQVHELRRPKHSGSVAIDGAVGRITYGASLAYVGRHFDQRDIFPFARVTLGSYCLANARVAYAVRPGIELFARATNVLGQHYEDVFGYRTEGRAAYVGVRLVDRRSSP